ncbi:hypothetical protein [Methylobacterium sp. C1]|uniref:hypothetical protein n=1 Tax=Methylobacterium sp. C1 TaxID=1479019 RepID=UPI000AB13F6F|nr:hypothetical protein [Methylobacterium sp. C1]
MSPAFSVALSAGPAWASRTWAVRARSAWATCRAISRTAGDGAAAAIWKPAAGGAAPPKAVAVSEPSAGLRSSIQARLGRGAATACGTGAAVGPAAATVCASGRAGPCGWLNTAQPARVAPVRAMSAVSRARRRARRMALG